MTRILAALFLGIAIGVYIGLRLVWAEEPQWGDGYIAGAKAERERPHFSGYVRPDLAEDAKAGAEAVKWTTRWFIDQASGETDDWATDPHLTTLTEGGNPR